jgi:membrane protease subunit HflC
MGKQMEIEGKKEKELKTIESNAYMQAEEIRGQADAEAVRIYAEAYGADPEFYTFLKTLETYESAMGEGVDLILTTDSDFFKYLKSIGELQ